MRHLWIVPLLLIQSASGCMFQNVSTAESLRDAVEGINDEARWSRVDLASQRVHNEYRQEYMAIHRRWGRDIQIADSELMRVELAVDRETAVSEVAVSWYSYRTMTLHRTVIRQRWARSLGHFSLRSERVIEGEASLLEAPEGPPDDELESDPADDLLAQGDTAR